MDLQSCTANNFRLPPDEPRWPLHKGINSIEELIAEARAGRCFVLIDDQSDIGAADVVIPAEFATVEVLNWMSRSVRGLIRLVLTQDRIRHFRLQTMARGEECDLDTLVTLSIQAKHEKMTGIPAQDCARTISVAIDDESLPSDIASPGHLFVLGAAEEGVLSSAGRGEAAVDISHIADLSHASVICEIMGEDGPLEALFEFRKFARQHDMKIGFISDVIAYRLRNERPRMMNGKR